jgi:hypothetical protein
MTSKNKTQKHINQSVGLGLLATSKIVDLQTVF